MNLDEQLIPGGNRMPNLSWSTNVQLSGQAPITLDRAPRAVSAHDYVQVTVDPGDADVPVALQPAGAARVRLLAVRADRYDANLTFKVSDGAGDTAAIPLDEPHVFAGGAIALFGRDPKLLRLSNGTGNAALVEVFVFRDAAP
jgi:hypothetical protein